MDSILVIAAHPDDEVLGCGGAIARHSELGDSVRVLIVSTGITSRINKISDDIHEEDLAALKFSAEKANQILGVESSSISLKISEYKEILKSKVIESDNDLENS